MIATNTANAANAGLAGIIHCFNYGCIFACIYDFNATTEKTNEQLQAKREMMKKVINCHGRRLHGKVFSVKTIRLSLKCFRQCKMRINKSSIVQVDLREVPERKGASVTDDVDVDDEDESAESNSGR